jgi:hypothetical protein
MIRKNRKKKNNEISVQKCQISELKVKVFINDYLQ